MPKFPDWLDEYQAVREQASELWSQLPSESDPAKAQQILELLITSQKMQAVWKRLYQKSHSEEDSGRYKYPGIVTASSKAAALRGKAWKLLKEDTKEEAAYLFFEAKLAEQMKDWGASPRWSEQDRAVKLFFWHIYSNAVNSKPMFRSDLEDIRTRLRRIAEQLRQVAGTVKSIGLRADAAELEKIVNTCEAKAKRIVPSRNDDPWVFEKRLGDEHLKTFVIATCYSVSVLFGQNLYGTVATIANVVFDPKVPVTTARVRGVIRASGKLREHE